MNYNYKKLSSLSLNMKPSRIIKNIGLQVLMLTHQLFIKRMTLTIASVALHEPLQ